MCAVDVVDGAGQPAPDLRQTVTVEAFNRGLILLGCGETSVRFCPPLCITESEVKVGLEIFDQAAAASRL